MAIISYANTLIKVQATMSASQEVVIIFDKTPDKYVMVLCHREKDAVGITQLCLTQNVYEKKACRYCGQPIILVCCFL